MATRLRSAGSGLSDAASSPPAAPDAGRSSGETAAALTQLTRAAAGLGALLGDYAQRLESSAGAYDQSDSAASAALSDAMSGAFGSPHVPSGGPGVTS